MNNASKVAVNSTQPLLSFHTTVSPTQPQTNEPWFFWLRIFVIVTLILFAAIGNLMVLYCLFTIKELQTVTGMFLTNLAATDLGVGFISLPLALASSIDRILINRRWFCVMQGIATVLFVVTSLLTLGVLSLSKYINVGYNMQQRFSKIHGKYSIAATWAIAAIFAVAPTFGFSSYSHRTGGYECTPYADNVPGYIYATLALIVVLIMPSLTMLYSYFKLYMKTHSHVRRIRVDDAENPSNSLNRLSSVESHMINTLIIMAICFFIWWMPALIIYILSFLKVLASSTLDTIFVICFFGNSAMNPILYAMRQKDFQRGFRQIIRRACRLQ